MANLDIALSGLRVAQRSLEIIGTNIANAATEGYHRQEPVISPQRISTAGNFSIGGASITRVRREMDAVLEDELLRLAPLLNQASQELLTLQSVESALGELGADGLMAAITRFFGDLQELAAQPDSQAFREQAIWAADTLARYFGDLGASLRDLDQHLRLEGQDLVSQVNNLTSEIATLNGEVEHLARRGGNPNLLLDRRDQAIAELSELIELRVEQVEDGAGVVNVIAFGTPLVISNTATELETGTTDDGGLGISVKDTGYRSADLSGGRLGGLFSLVNSILPEVRTKLDTLAGEIVHNINVYHVQGVGSAGDFTSITGWRVSDQAMDAWDAWGTHLQAGTFYVGVTDGNDASTTRYAVSVAASDTTATIAAKLDALDGLTASIADSALRIGVEDASRYSFEFLPAPVTALLGGWSGTATPVVSGVYTPQQDQLFTFTVTAGGTLGQSQRVTVEIKNQADEVVGTLDLGLGYAVGDRLQITDELYVAFAAGTLTQDDQFTIQALANSDSSGFLASAGINTFFKGNSLLTIAVDDEVMADPGRLASAVGADMGDNVNVRRMADLGERALPALGNISPTDSYRMILTGVGQRISFSRTRQSSLQSTMQQLRQRRDEVSGVDINAEAAKLLMFEQMFQAMAKVIASQNQAMQALMALI